MSDQKHVFHGERLTSAKQLRWKPCSSSVPMSAVGTRAADAPRGQKILRPFASVWGSVNMPHSCSLSQKLPYAEGIRAKGWSRPLGKTG